MSKKYIKKTNILKQEIRYYIQYDLLEKCKEKIQKNSSEKIKRI